MFAFRLLSATMIAAAVAVPAAHAEDPAICADGAHAMAMRVYSVALTRLDACLALKTLTLEQRVSALKQRGDAHFIEEDSAKAVADYERALQLGGPDLDILIALGRTHHTMESYEPALAVLDRAVALNGESAAAHYGRGLVLYHLGRYHDAVVAFGRQLAIEHDSADGHFYRAHSFFDMERFAEAITDFDAAIELNPFDSWA